MGVNNDYAFNFTCGYVVLYVRWQSLFTLRGKTAYDCSIRHRWTDIVNSRNSNSRSHNRTQKRIINERKKQLWYDVWWFYF